MEIVELVVNGHIIEIAVYKLAACKRTDQAATFPIFKNGPARAHGN